MLLGGLEPFSLIDYPGKTSCIVFTVGCNFRCGFCHNPELVLPNEKYTHYLDENYFFEFLDTRVGKLDAVVITGGEPTIHNDICEFIEKIKTKGFLVKLDTQGTRPPMLKKLLDRGLVDYIAMDIKNSLEKYEMTVNTKIDTEKIKKSIQLIKESSIDYEFRTTVVQGLHAIEDFKKIGETIQDAKLYVLQKFKIQTKMLDPSFQNAKTLSDTEFEQIQKIMEKYVEKCLIR